MPRVLRRPERLTASVAFELGSNLSINCLARLTGRVRKFCPPKRPNADRKRFSLCLFARRFFVLPDLYPPMAFARAAHLRKLFDHLRFGRFDRRENAQVLFQNFIHQNIFVAAGTR